MEVSSATVEKVKGLCVFVRVHVCLCVFARMFWCVCVCVCLSVCVWRDGLM